MSSPYTELRKNIIDDPSYAYGWHCMIAMGMKDNGISHMKANSIAAIIMANMFGVNMEDNELYQMAVKNEQTKEV